MKKQEPDESDIVSVEPSKRHVHNSVQGSKKQVSRRRKLMEKVDIKALDTINARELKLTALSANSCRIINGKLRQSLSRAEEPVNMKSYVAASDGFHVKSGDVAKYSGELKFEKLDIIPNCMCPSPERHMDKLTQYGQELPLACPTCWSIQRNS